MNNDATLIKRIGDRIAEARKTPLVRAVNAFMASPRGLAIIAALTIISNICAVEMVLYVLAITYGLYVCLLGDDFLSIAPLFVFCYIAPSRLNNPGRSDTTVFSGATGMVMIVLCCLLFLGIALRVALDPEFGFKKLFLQRRRLLWGMLVLGLAYVLSGIGSAHYAEIGGKNVLFALVQFATLLAPYFLFSVLVDWPNVRRDYIMWLGFFAGCVVAIEVFYLYLMFGGEFIADGVISNRWNIYLGWGMNNNIGAMLAIMMPFPFYLAGRYKHGYLFLLPAVCMMIALFMTVSRTSILFGAAVFVISAVLLIWFSKNRKINALVGGSMLALAVVLLLLLRQELAELFAVIFKNGLLNDSGRGDIYKSGFKVFLANPILGEGFYPSNMDTFVSAYWLQGYELTGFLPPRWHNTVIQLLAACGIVGLLAYSMHRLQTLWLIFRKPNIEKMFVGLAILSLLGMSLLDCHFFNLGPTLFYSVALAFAEGSDVEEGVDQTPLEVLS